MEKAMKAFPAVRFEVEWLPFFLNPNLPTEGMYLRDYIKRVYGDFGRVTMGRDRLKQAGAKLGINFVFNDDQKIFPTIRSHRLIELGTRQGKQDAIVERLFKLYFEEGGSLYDIADLTRAAEEAGVVGAKKYLESDEDEVAVYRRARAVQGGVTGVPHFTVSTPGGRAVSLSGGQPVEVFHQVFGEVLEAASP